MSEGGPPKRPGRRALGRRILSGAGPAAGKRALTNAGLRADRALDTAEDNVFRLLWFFLPAPAIARNLHFQRLLASRFFSDMGQQSLAFGALIAVTRGGGSAMEVALVGIVALIPPATLGLYGGAIADSLPKRVALAGVYFLQALMCFAVPTLFGTGLAEVLVLIFVVNTLGQVSGPTESSVLPLVATEEELASAVSMIGLATAAGTGVGTAVLAPVLVRAFGVEMVMYTAGGMLLLSASRVFDLAVGDKQFQLRMPPLQARFRAIVRWMVRHPAVATMVMLSVMSASVNYVLQTLAPRYVQDVLNADAADTAYVFAPSALGLVVALVSAPAIMRMRGERVTALGALFVAAVSLFLLGLVGDVASVIDPVNPVRLVELTGLSLNERLRTAALLAAPLAFGVSLTAAAVQTYINRRVPLLYQGRAFALQSAVRNGSAILPLLVLGAAASQFGVREVLLVTPLLLLVTGYGLMTASFRFAGLAAPSGLRVMESFWEEPATAGGNTQA